MQGPARLFPGLGDIRAFRAIHHHLATSGQPTARQFARVRDAGFDAVLNLALPTSDGALPDEPGLVRGLGMEHGHVPVDFERPSDADVHAFMGWMEGRRGRRVLVHCALNMRASAFVCLWRVLREGVPEEVARREMNATWDPDGPWRVLMERWLGRARDPGMRGGAPAVPGKTG